MSDSVEKNMHDNPRDIICFSRGEWHLRPWMNRQHVISRLTKWYRILYVTRPFYVLDLLRDGRAHSLSAGGLEHLGENLARYAPPKYLPLNYRFPSVEKALRRLRLGHLRRVCRRLNFVRPILLLWDPEFQDMVGQFNESLICYFVDDQYSLFSGAKPTAAEEEKPLVKAADLVLCTSETLCQDKGRLNPNVFAVGNGVDYSLFATTTSPHLPVAPELKELKQAQRPILGFVGILNDKVDYELLATIARDNPGWLVILIGPDKIYTSRYRNDFNQLLACSNVRWFGLRPAEELPSYLKGMDVCTIPNKVNEYTRYVYPMKLHEYLAAGKPIISTDIPSVRSFEGLVRIAQCLSDWRRHLQEALNERGPEWVRRRQAVAMQNTWEVRAERVDTLLTDVVAKHAARNKKDDGACSSGRMKFGHLSRL